MYDDNSIKKVTLKNPYKNIYVSNYFHFLFNSMVIGSAAVNKKICGLPLSFFIFEDISYLLIREF
jgi:hypothetical protein